MGCRYHLHPELGRLSLSGGGARCVQPQDVGWAMETHLRTELVLKALDMALGQRRASGVWFIIPTRAVSTPRSPSANAARRRGTAVDGLGGRLFRQRDLRELLRHA
jgi:hypothetical protein